MLNPFYDIWPIIEPSHNDHLPLARKGNEVPRAADRSGWGCCPSPHCCSPDWRCFNTSEAARVWAGVRRARVPYFPNVGAAAPSVMTMGRIAPSDA